jgi:putative pyruvate formate lyase activating enzyme
MDPILSSLQHCELCPRRCGADRIGGEKGFCRAGASAVVAHYGPHFGEEPPISGSRGSGTVFFSPCNLRCVFCQNYQISHVTIGTEVSVEGLAAIFCELEKAGVHNVNLVSPTPYAPLIALAIRAVKEKGFSIPFVYNTNSYENRETIRIMAGLVDIYLPDLKYWSPAVADRLSAAPAYPTSAMAAIEEMWSQVGDLAVKDEVATRGLLLRHLVLPGGLAGTGKVIGWIKERLGAQTAMSLMSQYHPVCRAKDYPLINRRIRNDEYDRHATRLFDAGFRNVYVQEMESAAVFLPDFKKDSPFEG